ncbi:MAG: cytochrome C oxidase subunit IV [Schaalia odontolytica]
MSDTASLITLRSILDIEIARSYEWDTATIIALSGVDRPGDLTTRIVEVPGALTDIAAEGFSPHSAAGHALSHELHDAIQRRVRLWIAEIPTDQLTRLHEAFGDGIVHEAGQPRGANTPIAMSPLELLEQWASGSDEQRKFMRTAMAGLDTLTSSSHATRASRAVGASIIERSPFLRLCRNPKFIAYVVVFVYSMARAVPVMFVPHFGGDWRILWLIDVVTAIPYTWGLIEMVAGQKLWHRIAGAVTASVTFLAPYVYFLLYGRHAPPGIWFAIACIFFGGIFLEVFRYLRDRAVKKGLAEQL